MTNKTAQIKEIFTSIQGEGQYIGYKQLFIRFCGCNLHCEYCDTDFDVNSSKTYSIEELSKIINNADCHSVSLTGGEPLLHSKFLSELLPKINKKIYLETNATLVENLVQIIDYVDFVAADIKLPSCTGLAPCWDKHDKFFEIAHKKELFIKVVFDNNITDEEINKSCELAKKYSVQLIIQPKMNNDKLSVSNTFIEEIYTRFFNYYKNIRLIPQMHKFLNLQ